MLLSIWICVCLVGWFLLALVAHLSNAGATVFAIVLLILTVVLIAGYRRKKGRLKSEGS